MPVEELPAASWLTSLGLGFLSSVFDNIPLTALALKQGGYDWGFLACCVGFGGSMIWFGSYSGVAISNMYPEAKSVGLWLRHGWFIAVSYSVGFFAMFAIVGWNADAPHQPHAVPHRRKNASTGSNRSSKRHQDYRPSPSSIVPSDPFGGVSVFTSMNTELFSGHLRSSDQFAMFWNAMCTHSRESHDSVFYRY